MVRGTLTPALSRRERVREPGIALPGDVADRQRRDGRPQRMIRGEDAVVAMPVLARQRDEISQPVEELER